MVRLVGLEPDTLELVRRLELEPDQWLRLFSLRVSLQVAGEALPAVAASYRVGPAGLELIPRFPLDPGVRYRASFDPALLEQLLEQRASAGGRLERDAAAEPVAPVTLDLAPRRAELPATTVVEAAYPSGDVLPENLLKFYLYFSAPMSQGRSWRHISLLDASEEPVDLPFVELEHELWDPSGRRLTVLLDPGRIKSGLRPRRELGPALEGGEDFALRIDRAWLDASGQSLREGHRKGFRVGAADHDSPRPERWRLAPPAAGSRAPLAVELDEAVDHALGRRLIWIEGPEGSVLPGRVELARHETVWCFVPEHPWQSAGHELVVDPWLEDLSGNSVGRPFEVDLSQVAAAPPAEPRAARRPFTPSSTPASEAPQRVRTISSASPCLLVAAHCMGTLLPSMRSR